MRAYLTLDDQLVVRDATSGDALTLWRTLQQAYLARRGPVSADAADAPIPATTHRDVIEVVNLFEGLAGSIRCSAAPDLDDWRHAYVHTFALIARAPDLRAVFPYNDVVWLGLTLPLAARLAATAATVDR